MDGPTAILTACAVTNSVTVLMLVFNQRATSREKLRSKKSAAFEEAMGGLVHLADVYDRFAESAESYGEFKTKEYVPTFEVAAKTAYHLEVMCKVRAHLLDDKVRNAILEALRVHNDQDSGEAPGEVVYCVKRDACLTAIRECGMELPREGHAQAVD